MSTGAVWVTSQTLFSKARDKLALEGTLPKWTRGFWVIVYSLYLKWGGGVREVESRPEQEVGDDLDTEESL
jgi:hypothetical protein